MLAGLWSYRATEDGIVGNNRELECPGTPDLIARAMDHRPPDSAGFRRTQSTFRAFT